MEPDQVPKDPGFPTHTVRNAMVAQPDSDRSQPPGERVMTVLTPTDVRNIAFRKPPLGRRGYDEDEVDSFLDRVEASLTVLYREITRLQEELEVVRSTPATPGTHQWAVVPEVLGDARSLGNPEFQPYLPQPYHGHDPSPDAALKTELDLVKRRLAWIEHMLGTVPNQNQTLDPPHPT